MGVVVWGLWPVEGRNNRLSTYGSSQDERPMARKKRGVCTYCGSTGPVTMDHVPPRSVFASNPPPDPITVPACKACHSSKHSLDDEYLRNCLALSDRSGDSLDAEAARTKFFRSLSYHKARRLKERFLQTISPMEVRTAQGLYLGRRTGYDVDHLRLERAMARIIRGLFFNECGERLPSDAMVSVYSMLEWAAMPQETKESLGKILRPLQSVPEMSIGDGTTFQYRHTHVPGMICFSGWLLTFYGGLHFLGLTTHEASLEKKGQVEEDVDPPAQSGQA